MKRSILFGGLLVAVALVHAAAEEEPAVTVSPEARAVLEAAVESMGGETALAEIRGMTVSVSGTYRWGEVESPYTATTTLEFPDCFRWKLVTPAFTAEMGVNHGEPWSAFMAPPARAAGAAAKSMKEWFLNWEMLLVRPLLSHPGAKITLAGEEEGKKTVAVEIGDIRQEMTFKVSDGKTRLVGVRGDMTHMDGRKGRMEAVNSEPKDFGGITLPSKVSMKTWADGELLENLDETITAIEWNPEVPEGTYEMPEPEMTFGEPKVGPVPGYTAVATMHVGPYEEMGETIGRIQAIVAEKKLMPAGGIVATFLDDPATVEDPAKRRTRIAMMVALMGPPPELPEGVTLENHPEGRAVTMFVKGEYGTVESDAIPKLAAWMGEHGHSFAGPPEVVYLHDPDGTLPADQIAQIRIPIGE